MTAVVESPATAQAAWIGSRISTKHYEAGTHRVCSPSETVEHLRRLMPRVGITRLADVTGLDHVGIPVVQAVRPNARTLSVSQGKGLDLAAATASALGESIELWHAECLDAEFRLGSWREMRSTRKVADIEHLPRTADSRISPDLTMLWIEGVELFSQVTMWVPFECVSLDGTLRSFPGRGCFPRDSNGLASGNTFQEAISHGLCELIERDATTLWHCGSAEEQAVGRVDLATIDDPHCREILTILRNARLDVAVWNLTSDVGLPVFAASVIDAERCIFRPLGPFGGYGCHADRGVALSRALTEAVQGRLTRIAGSRDDGHYEVYRSMASSVADQESRLRLASGADGSFTDVTTIDNATIDADVEDQLARLQTVGVTQVIAVDLRKADLGVPVVKMVVPGLEGSDHNPVHRPGRRATARLRASVS